MTQSAAPNIKREKKKSLYLRELSIFIDSVSQDQPILREVYLSRVDLSSDGGICYLYFATIPALQDEQEADERRFNAALQVLKLYKPSLRKALAQSISSRYTPDLLFLYDDKQQKIDRVNALLDQVSQELGTNTVDCGGDES